MKITIKTVKANPDLATQENFNKKKDRKYWSVRYEMVKANPELATQKNFNKEEDEFVRSKMTKLNPNLKDN